MNKAVIIGATGAVGKNILQKVLQDNYYQKVYILGRKTIMNIDDNEKLEKIVVDFENLDFDKEILNNADVFAALGTTIKVAKTKENQKKIDVDYTVNFAKYSEGLVKSFNLVSAIGADSSSKNFYTSLKGMLEDELNKFNLGVLRVYRPSLLLTKRKELRIGEFILIKLAPLFKFVLRDKNRKYSPIEAEFLAKEMIRFAKENREQGIYTYNDFK